MKFLGFEIDEQWRAPVDTERGGREERAFGAVRVAVAHDSTR